MAAPPVAAPASFPGKDWPMEDRLAAMIAAVLYTSDHIDLVQYTKLPDPGGLAKDKAKFVDQQRVAAIESLDKAKDRLLEPSKSVPPLYDYSKQQFIYHTPAETKPQLIVKSHDISELDFDTVAIVLFGAVLFVACNYKIRSTVVTENGRYTVHKISYKGFGEVSQTAIMNVKSILVKELPQVATVKEVILLGPAKDPEDDKQNAAPHAEMQILSHLMTQVGLQNAGKLYFGVSKPCCSECAAVLDKCGYKYREKAALKVTNWLPPEKIETKVKYSERYD